MSQNHNLLEAILVPASGFSHLLASAPALGAKEALEIVGFRTALKLREAAWFTAKSLNCS
jgi:hypothetical protein